MNDRIRELIVSLEPDAFMTYKGYLYHSGDPKVSEHSDPEPLYTRQELVKFAQLIVKKCAGIYSKIDNGNLHMGTDNYLEALYKTFRS
jgi:hypothetical protein